MPQSDYLNTDLAVAGDPSSINLPTQSSSSLDQQSTFSAAPTGAGDQLEIILHTNFTDSRDPNATSLQTDFPGTVEEFTPGPELKDPVVVTASTDSTGASYTATPATGDSHGAIAQTMLTATAGPPEKTQAPVNESQTSVVPKAESAVPSNEHDLTSGQGPEGTENVELEDTC
ncbi:uncharacterized protein si:ch211-80h18.1 isoform X1 [Polypterus senegalus]|uniref:uncharacterized protein si:ch211-80h18.1 isoform X1 n=1 Tax=Polypterus senegalus TaxID=55291 RepID=UPI0019626B85|nr:uncharacterized protein si:ch211-80h18.1 isoform X1 [Polypterus senegalus]XP_039593093.1 uncharacterized protein si:ch211-80h18.1 isoform X1 [Polypterus senegalus]